MHALIRLWIGTSFLLTAPAFANAPAPANANAHASPKAEATAAPKKESAAMTKNSKGVVPALLPDIADPSTVHGDGGDALHLQASSPENGESAEAEEAPAPAPAVESNVPVAKKAAPAKPVVHPVAPAAQAATDSKVETEEVAAPNSREQAEKLAGVPLPEMPIEPEVAVILSAKRFFPARIRLKEGQSTRLLFTSLNPRPAALVIEQLQVQRWIASEKSQAAPSGMGRVPAEILREIGNNRMTEILLQPQRGTYTFHDALSGAVGEIVVE